MATLVVQKDYIVENYNALMRETGVLVIPVLKGNAYGLGESDMARILWDAGARVFAASRIEEALRLHNILPEAEIILLTPYGTEDDAEKIVDAGITATADSYNSAVLLNGIAEKRNVKCRVHFAFDTGMGRFGFLPQDADKAVKAAKFLNNLTLVGCFTHLSNSFGKHKKDVAEQCRLFNDCIKTLKDAGIDPGILHMANSNAALRYPETRYNAVRCGSALLGRVAVKNKAGLKRVGYLQSSICDIRWLPAGHNVGYANTYKTKKPMRIAVVPSGYADGLFTEKTCDTFRVRDALRSGLHDFKSLFKRGSLYCSVNGKKVPVVGRVGMCNVVLDVSNIECHTGDTVTFEINPILVNANVERKFI
jgi:alanine racemase